MKRIWSALFVGVCFCTGIVFAQEERNQLALEDLMFMDISVVTASKKAQSLADAPATVAVITSDDIQRSGALTIPDLLRNVPGVEVMAFNTRNQQVSIRGFNEFMSNKMLVMIDGRSVYWEAYGFVFWDALHIVLDEIDRIEI